MLFLEAGGKYLMLKIKTYKDQNGKVAEHVSFPVWKKPKLPRTVFRLCT
jgi:hypothetical protein